MVSNAKALSWLILCHLFLFAALKIPRLLCGRFAAQWLHNEPVDDITSTNFVRAVGKKIVDLTILFDCYTLSPSYRFGNQLSSWAQSFYATYYYRFKL